MGDNRWTSHDSQYFPEYSLWNASTFCAAPVNFIAFTRPVNDSIFLTSPCLVEKTSDEALKVPPPPTRHSPGFERYMKRALKVITRDDLFRDPSLFKKDDNSGSEADSESEEPKLLRPTRPRLRPGHQSSRGRGRRLNLMQERLEEALAQPAKIERGASMMQRMGWDGGALGRSGSGIVEPISPISNYSLSTAGFGLNASDSGQDSPPDSGCEGQAPQTQKKRTKTCSLKPKTKKQIKQDLKTNILLYIREFIKNDLQIELFFEPKLKNVERKRIHMMVAHLMGAEEEHLETEEMEELAEDIARRNRYALATHSEGNPPFRQICVYKEAKEATFLITPEDIRIYPETEQEEETNPFLKSITKNLKKPEETYTPEPNLLEKIIDFFVDFSQMDDYTEFRFLGPFNIDEIDIMSSFFGMVTCVTERRPYLDYPERLVQVFEKGVVYSAEEDANGFVSVKKHIKPKKQEESAEDNI